MAQFHHTAWAIRDGMPANIWAIAQSRDGYLWLGSVNGLYRFDGARVERIAADQLPSPSVHALAASSDGGLWIGYERPVGVVSLLKDGKVRSFPVAAPSTTSIHQIEIAPDGSVWASTADNILRFDGKRFAAVDSDWGSSFAEGRGGVWSFGIGRDGTVWSRNLNYLYYLRPGQSRFRRAASNAGGAEGFTHDRNGRLWTADCAAEQLVALPDPISPNRDRAASPTSAPSSSNILQGPILLDRDNTLWCVSIDRGGLKRVNVSGASRPVKLDGFSQRDGLTSNLVRTIFEDREGNVWVGTSLGLDRFRASNIVAEPTIPAGYRARFIQATPNALYAYTGWSSTATRTKDGSESIYKILPNEPPKLFIRNVGRLRGMDYDARTGIVWVASQQGVQPIRDGRLGSPVPLPPGVAGTSVYSSAHDMDGRLWISAYGRGVFRRDARGWLQVSVRSKLGATAVLIPDPAGGMWVRYSGGTLLRVDGNSVRDFSRNSLGIGDVTFIQPQGRSLIVGGESGIGKIENGKFYSLKARDIAPISGVTGIATTSDGTSWIFTQAGILRTPKASLDEALRTSNPRALRYQLLDSRDGLPGAPYGAIYGNTVATDASGRLWFTTGDGLVWVDPHNLHHNDVAPQLDIQGVSVKGRPITPSRQIKLPAGVTDLEIDYTAMSLSIPDRVHFRYRMDGVDSDWVDAGNRRQAFYTRLGPGTFNFHVIAANDDGVWNREGTSVEFVVPPTFLQSSWFKLLMLTLAAVAAWLFLRWRSRQIAARIQGRMEERIAERERIARDLHDTLLQGVQGLMLRFQSVLDRLPKDNDVRDAMDGALKRADQFLVEGRNRVVDLRDVKEPQQLDDRLSAEIEAIFGQSNIAAHLRTIGERRAINPIVSDEMFAIAREAMCNASSHSEAQSIAVLLAYAAKTVELSVVDDGVGIDRPAGRDGRLHFGLIGMQERASKIGAQLVIEGRRGGGTSVGLKVPGGRAYVDQAMKFSLRSLLAKFTR